MDLKELLPFIIVVAISIIGSLTKKKPKKDGAPQKKNVFETLLDEINGRNTTEVHESPEVEMDAYQQEYDDEVFEPAYESVSIETTPEVVKVEKPKSLLDLHLEKLKKKKQGKSWSPLEVIDIEEGGKARHDLRLDNPDEAKKAILYAEIIKPRYF